MLALVTAPRYDPRRTSRRGSCGRTAPSVSRPKAPVGSPLPERAFRSFQIPGSIMKPFTALAALGSGDGTFDEVIVCEREFRYEGIRAGGILRCNKRHDGLDMHGALRDSCNIYFQTLVARMIDEKRFPAFVEMGRRFGFGQRTGIEIQGRGRMGRFEFSKARQRGTLIAASIGQGWVEASPAQVARAYAGLMTGRLPAAARGRACRRRRHPNRAHPAPHPPGAAERVRAALRDVPRPGGSATTTAASSPAGASPARRAPRSGACDEATTRGWRILAGAGRPPAGGVRDVRPADGTQRRRGVRAAAHRVHPVFYRGSGSELGRSLRSAMHLPVIVPALLLLMVGFLVLSGITMKVGYRWTGDWHMKQLTGIALGFAAAVVVVLVPTRRWCAARISCTAWPSYFC